MNRPIASPAEYQAIARRLEVPDHLVAGLVRYFIDRIRPGHFLCAVIANDLREAASRASDISVADIRAILYFFDHAAPYKSTGNYETLERWLTQTGKDDTV